MTDQWTVPRTMVYYRQLKIAGGEVIQNVLVARIELVYNKV